MGRTGGDESPGTLFTGTGYRQPRDVRQTVLVCGVCRTDCGNVWDERKQCVRKTDASAQKAEKETGEGGCSVMRKSEKLSDAIGEISDDIIEEAYTYKPKHDMHQRKASFKWRAAAAVLAMFVLAGVGVSVGGGTSFFRIGTIVSRFTGKAAKVVYRIQGIPVTQQEIQAGVALRVENGETVKTAKKEVIKDIITKKTLYVLAKKNGCTVSDQEYDD